MQSVTVVPVEIAEPSSLTGTFRRSNTLAIAATLLATYVATYGVLRTHEVLERRQLFSLADFYQHKTRVHSRFGNVRSGVTMSPSSVTARMAGFYGPLIRLEQAICAGDWGWLDWKAMPAVFSPNGAT